MIQIMKDVGRIARPQVGTTDHRHRVTPWLLRMAMMLAVLIFPTIGYAQTIKYLGSIPESGAEITSLDKLTLSFDLSAVYDQLGGAEEDWGICCNTFAYTPGYESMEKTITVYEGDQDGIKLAQIAKTIKPTHDDFVPGNSISITFPEFEIKSGQLYTVVIKYIFLAGKVGDTSWTSSTKLDCQTNPIVLQFYGTTGVEPSLSLQSCDINEQDTYEEISSVKFTFSSEVEVSEDISVLVKENDNIVVSSNKIEMDEDDSKSIIVSFPTTPLYYSHEYNIVLPSGIVFSKGNSESKNTEISIPIYGGAYFYFGLGRGLNPVDGSVSILDEIVVPIKLPQSESITYGFSDSGDVATMHIYAGNMADGEEILSIPAEIDSEGGSLIFHPNYAFNPSSEYTMVIPEGDVRLYDLSSRKPSHQQEFVSERIELHYSTPSVEDLPKWNPSPMNVKNDEEISELKYFILDCPEYEYEGTTYNTKSSGKIGDKGALYIITDTGEELVKTFPITRKTLNYDSEIGNGELNGRYFVGEVNETLYEGTDYRVIWLAESFIVDNPFIGRYISNPEVAVTLKGATPTVNDFGLIANIDNRLHSHADVFSFVTESEVKAGENAKMILKDGEESVAEAPVYVSREANGHRVYADFGGKKLDAGKSYDVVLPEGSVYATNGIVNNPEIKSAITAIPETPAAPEFISVALNIDEYASATYRMVKGQESVLDLKAGEDWKLERLKLNGEDVTADVAENGLYTLPALDEDANLDATYAYAHAIDYDYETGVGSIEDLPYSLSKDGSHVIISGLNGGERITIYTMGGMKIASPDTVPADMHQASIALPEGQIYIIMINNTSIKWKH